jgi:hypothetical protein
VTWPGRQVTASRPPTAPTPIVRQLRRGCLGESLHRGLSAFLPARLMSKPIKLRRSRDRYRQAPRVSQAACVTHAPPWPAVRGRCIRLIAEDRSAPSRSGPPLGCSSASQAAGGATPTLGAQRRGPSDRPPARGFRWTVCRGCTQGDGRLHRPECGYREVGRRLALDQNSALYARCLSTDVS